MPHRVLKMIKLHSVIMKAEKMPNMRNESHVLREEYLCHWRFRAQAELVQQHYTLLSVSHGCKRPEERVARTQNVLAV